MQKQKQPSRNVLRKKQLAKQLYWNHTSAWVFSCTFAAYFQYKFSQEHFWRVTSVETDTYRNKAIKDDGNAYIDIDDDK